MAEKKQTNKKSGTLNRYFYSKTWQSGKHVLMSQDEINHRLYNDLPLDDLLDDKIKKYSKNKPGGGRPKKINGDETML